MRGTGPGWLDQVRRVPLASVLAALGRQVARQRWGPCPLCGAEKSGHEDRRGPVGVTRDGGGWRCHRCDAAGDGLDLVALAVASRHARDLQGDVEAWTAIRTWYADRGWCDPTPGSPTRPARPRPVVPPPPPPPEEPPAELPNPSEVAALWDACAPLDATGPDASEAALLAAGWLDRRALWPPWDLAALDLARVLPDPATHPFPAWLPARWWPTWSLAIPTWTAAGDLGGLRLRRLDAGGHPKERAPLARASAGLVLACPVALSILRGAPDPTWDGRVVLVEGVPDFLTWALRPGPSHLAVFGQYAGAWTADHAARIPPAAPVVVATHDDPAGDRFAAALAATFPPNRNPIRRIRP